MASGLSVLYPGGFIDLAAPRVGDERLHRSNKKLAASFSRLEVVKKGLELILDTAPLLAEVDFLIAGNPHGDMRPLKANLPSNIRLVSKDNWLASEKLQLYRECDVFLAPYVHEDFGITPIEANSFGKPVVYCEDGGGILESQVHKVTGYMSKRQPRSFASGIMYCIENGENMATACIQNARRFDWHFFEEGISQAIDLLIGRH